MNISIITVYHPFTNLGSYLQAYALQKVLSKMGHDVTIAKTGPHVPSALKLISHLNPKREFFLRFKKAYFALKDLYRLRIIGIEEANKSDLLIFGSDEIWNVTNKFFQQPIFWGIPFQNVPMIGYAVSVGHAMMEDFETHSSLTSNLTKFSKIFSRDKHTQDLLKSTLKIESELVIDPTLLVEASSLSEPIEIPKEDYLLVYTYGLDSDMICLIRQFAKNRNLKIVSPCFWHSWADTIIECSALQFSTLIRGAKYVFTSTFHGAIFSLINHKQCCILPIRDKVRAICETLKCEDRLINELISIKDFEKTMNLKFDINGFEANLNALRVRSLRLLEDSIKNCER